MESSLTNFELTESTLKSGSDSGSDKSEPTIEAYAFGDTDSSNGSSKSDEDFDNHLPETVSLLKCPKTGAKVYLVGTAHFSANSQRDVENVIRNVKPNMIVIELCKSRTNILTLDEETILEEAKNINFQKIASTIKTNGIYNGLLYLLLLDISAHITKETGMAPGGEFRVAYKEASKLQNCSIHLGDRPINITLKRALSRLTCAQTLKLIWHLINSKGPVSIEDIEKCKDKDILEQLLEDFAGEYKAFREVLLDERDIFLTYSLQSAANIQALDAHSGKPDAKKGPIKIVGVVGLGHCAGIKKLWPIDQKPFIKDILTVPPPSMLSKVIRVGFRVSLISLGGFLIYKYVPVPSTLRENAHYVIHTLITSVTTTTSKVNFRTRNV